MEFEEAALIISFARDITDRKRAEQERATLEAQLLQAQKMEAVGELAGGIAHDFNNILQSIMGYTQLVLLEAGHDSKTLSKLTEIERASIKAADLIRQLLTFSRKIDSHLKPVNLNQEISRMRELLERTFPKMISIDLILDPSLRDINADGGQIEQVIMNLSINAMHAMPLGGRLAIETANATLDEEFCRSNVDVTAGEYVVLTVSDTGTGMDQETLARIYEPFFTTKGVGKGTGLGLSMVYGIVMNHGATIKCESEPGKGTRFRIWFPAIVDSDSRNVKHAQRIECVPVGTETVMLIDEDPLVLEMGKQMLSQHGYRCITAGTGREGLELYSILKGQIDLVVLDLNTPGVEGCPCLEGLRKLNPEIKVLLSSGYFHNGSVSQSLAGGAMGLIGKPFLLSDFMKAVRDCLDTCQALR